MALLVLSSCEKPQSPAEAGAPLPRTLSAENAEEGLFLGMVHLFTIPDYFDYGNFEPQECTELPGKLFRATAQGKECPTAFLVSGQDDSFPGPLNTYSLEEGSLYTAWRVKRPESLTPQGRYSYVHPGETPWQMWLEQGESGEAEWNVALIREGQPVMELLPATPAQEGWDEVRLKLEPDALEVEINREGRGRFAHDRYPAEFRMHFGSAQPDPDGAPVTSEYRHVFFHRFPYPYGLEDIVAEGPEDVRPEDKMIWQNVVEAVPNSPRHSEGDLIELKDRALLLVWSDYFTEEGWDRSPARLSAKVSRDGGKTWGAPWTVVEWDAESPAGNVMSVSLLQAKNGDLLMAYHGEKPDMKEEGTLLRTSSDEGKTWSEARQISPDNGNVHAANNACFRRLRGGRILLSSREYIDRVRWPYALYSDDEGLTWTDGERVPHPDLTPEQVRRQNVNEPTVAELPDGRLLMMMRSVAGGHFFSYSEDQGETWSKPYLSPLRGIVAPGYITTIPSTGDMLAIWSRGMTRRTPLNSAISRDGGKTWSPVKLLDRSEYHGYGYTSVTFVGDRVHITTMRYPQFPSLERFQVQPGYVDLLHIQLPVEWFYRNPEQPRPPIPS